MMQIVFTVYWIESTSVITLHLLCFCLVFHLRKHNGWFIAVAILCSTLQTHERLISLIALQQEQSFNEVTWCMGESPIESMH
jgi:hypothetical protein